MCGRYAIVDGKKVFLTFELMKQMRQNKEVFEILPRYNASPMQKLPVVAVRNKELTMDLMQWWLIPHWAPDSKPAYSTFNAKAETIDKKGVFVAYFKGSRCLVPADAFYEWKKYSTEKEVRGKTKTVEEKQPMCVRMKDKKPFMFAGVFSVWVNKKTGEELPTFSIITTDPNKLMAPIHNRMPVILNEKDFDMWLDRDFKDTDALKKLLVPFPPTKMQAYPVSTIVSSSRNDVPECMEPIKVSNSVTPKKAATKKPKKS